VAGTAAKNEQVEDEMGVAHPLVEQEDQRAQRVAHAAGARRLPLATLGLVQYLAPTISLLLGVWVFHEPFDSQRLIGFVFIWSALALVSASALGLRLPRPA